jgi:sugar lactone lactonase YvrE
MSFSVFASDSISDVSFNAPIGLVFDASGYLYCANGNGNNILKFDASGSGTIFASDSISDVSFNFPIGLAIDSLGNLYCSNYNDYNILKFDASGSGMIFASESISDVSFNYPVGLVFDASGYLYCTNGSYNNILKLDASGSGTIFASISDASSSNPFPYALAIDNSGFLYCANYNANNILKFDASGSGTIFASNSISDVSFNNPVGLVFDTLGYLYCTNLNDNNILKFDASGSGTIFASTSDASFNKPYGLAIDTSGFLYCSNRFSNNILKSIDILCFNEDTKILCLNHSFEEEYIPIQDLKKGDLVKTYLHGYRKVDLIHKGVLFNNPNDWRNTMYKMEKTEENGLLEDLIVTGGHSILVDSISQEEQERLDKLGLSDFQVNYKFDNKYLLLASVSDHFIPLTDNKKYTYYHLTLENNGDDNQQFGIWANEVLTETTCKNYLLSKI